MRVLKVVAIMVVGPLLGVTVGLLAAFFLMRNDAGDVRAYADAANGMVLALCVIGGLGISVTLSIALAILNWQKPPKPNHSTNG